MKKLFSEVLLVLLLGGLFLSTVFSLIAQVFGKEKLNNVATRALSVGFIFLFLYICLRWWITRHPPVQGNFENAILCSFFILMLYFVFKRKYVLLERGRWFFAGFSLLIIGWGLMQSGSEMAPLEPPFKSFWLWFHVGFAWIAFGSFTISAALGGYYIYRRKEWDSDLDRILVKFVFLGFVAQGFMILTGSIWAYNLWGSYWSWDPVETWSLICWLIYGLYLHMRFVMGWKGKLLAWLTIFSFIAMIITFFGTSYLSQYHTVLL